MTSLPEQLGVENPAIAWLVRLGYTHWVGKQVKVKLEQRHLAPVLEDVLRARLQVLNPWLDSSAVTTALLELRKRVNDELLPANTPAHMSFPGVGHLRKDGKGYRFVPLPYLNDYYMVK